MKNKKKVLTSMLCIVIMLLSTFSAYAASQFTDVKQGAWYEEHISYAVENGIFNGTSATTFSPNTNMTRAQFVQVFANISNVDTSNKNVSSSFSDVPSGKWYTAAVKWAAENGVVNGMGDGKFAPEQPVTREQMCVMLVNYVEKFQKKSLDSTINAQTFKDDAKMASWAKDSVYKCAKAGLVNGVGNNMFDPQGTTTRAQGATFFSNFHKYSNPCAQGHTESDWIVDKEATEEEEGARHKVCSSCNSTVKIETIPKITPSQGLEFTFVSDDVGGYYYVSGIGTCTDTDIVIPSKYNGLPVRAIGNYAFSNCSTLKSVTIPGSVAGIRVGAFANCASLEIVTISCGYLSGMGKYVFYNCLLLERIDYKDWTGCWYAIDKGDGCFDLTGNYKIYCTDAIIDKTGRVTYY